MEAGHFAPLPVPDPYGVSRRTPLDDALAGGFWMCAKLLICYGAKNTITITPAIKRMLEDTPIEEIRETLHKEKVKWLPEKGAGSYSHVPGAQRTRSTMLGPDRSIRASGKTQRSTSAIT